MLRSSPGDTMAAAPGWRGHLARLGLARTVLVLTAVLVAVSAAPVDRATFAARVPAKMIALSFDDAPRGPGGFMTVDQRNRRLIAGLRASGVDQAVFFANPGRISAASGHEERLRRYVAAGHVLANHTWLHPRLSDVSPEAFLADVARADDWLRRRPGFRPWFRFPALDEGGPDKPKRDKVRAGLRALGLSNGFTTVDGSDWYIDGMAGAARKAGKPIDMAALRDLYVETMVQSADFSDDLMRRTLGRAPPQMLLLHETDLAALFVPDLVAALRRDGWTIVTADQAFADPVYRSAPDIPWANGTLAEQLAWEKKLPAPRWYERNDLKLASALFVERALHGPKAPLPVPLPDAAALARAAALPHIPAPLRGCWQAPGVGVKLIVDYATIRLAGTATRFAMADTVSAVTPRSIQGNFLLSGNPARTTLARTLSLGPDASGTPPGQLSLSGGVVGSRAFSRCT